MIPHVPHAKKVKGSVRGFEKGREGAGHTGAEAGAADQWRGIFTYTSNHA